MVDTAIDIGGTSVPNTLKVSGKITEVYEGQEDVITTIRLPQVDEYTSGGFVEVRSKRSLGIKDQVVKDIEVFATGYQKTFSNDKGSFRKTYNILRVA